MTEGRHVASALQELSHVTSLCGRAHVETEVCTFLSTENTFCGFTFILVQKLLACTNASRRLTSCPTLCSSRTSSSSKEQFDPPALLAHHAHDVISYPLSKLLAARGFNGVIFRWCVFRNSAFFLYRVISSKPGFFATLFYLLPRWEKIQNCKFAPQCHNPWG